MEGMPRDGRGARGSGSGGLTTGRPRRLAAPRGCRAVAEKLLEHFARTRDTALYSPDRAAADGCGFLVRQAARADEQQRRALAGRQRGQRAVEFAQFDLAVVIRKYARLRQRARVHAHGLELLAAHLRVVLVAQDREEPRLKIGSGLEALDVGQRPQQRLLNQVSCTYGIPAQRTREVMHLGHQGHHVVGYHAWALRSD